MSSRKMDGYLGNSNLKPAGIEIEFTKNQVEEYVKCAKDPIYFIKTYVKVVSLDKGLIPFDLYDYQEELLNIIHNNRFAIAKLPRQSGKSTSIVAYILHYVLFNQSMNVAILANKQSTSREILYRLKLAYEYLPLWLQQGIIEWNKGSIELENGSKIVASSTSASAIRGGSFNMIFLDEFAHVPNNIAEEFFSSVYPTVTSGQTTKVLMVSTPNGLNLFYYYWKNANKKRGEKGKNEYIPFEVHWTQIPLYPGGPFRDQKWKETQIQNTSEQQFQTEFECDFIGSTNTLISSSKLHVLSWDNPILKSTDGMDIYEESKEDHQYIITVDTARGQGKDYSAFVVFDITDVPYKICAKFRNNLISPMVYPTVIKTVAEKYNDAYVLIETNDIGSQVADVLHQDLEYDNIASTVYKGRSGQVISSGFGGANMQRGVRTTIPVKKLGCSVLKSLVENDKLLIPDIDVINELYTFVAKGQSYEADDGHTDDLSMCLVLFGWLTRQDYFKNLTERDVRLDVFQDEISRLEEEVMPFGLISGFDDEDDDGEWEKVK
jgi:hypothetical protein|tara:strand:+ start:2893 stop:4536 length:1644 start_codon:yes stop_codon:yes gene_type:complete